MATGQPPWREFKSQQAAMFHIGEAIEGPEIPQNLSKDAKDFLSRCFKYEPEERYNVFELLRHPWIQKLDDSKY